MVLYKQNMQAFRKVVFSCLLGLSLFIPVFGDSWTYTALSPKSQLSGDSLSWSHFLKEVRLLQKRIYYSKSKQSIALGKEIQLPGTFSLHFFRENEKEQEISQLWEDINGVYDYVYGNRKSRKEASPFIKEYTNWLDSFMGNKWFDQDDYNDSEALITINTLLVENARQHGGGQMVLILGQGKDYFSFSVISKRAFTNVPGALTPRDERGAKRAKTGSQGLALSEVVPINITTLNQFFYEQGIELACDVLIEGKGQYSYTGLSGHQRGYTWLEDTGRRGAAIHLVLFRSKDAELFAHSIDPDLDKYVVLSDLTSDVYEGLFSNSW